MIRSVCHHIACAGVALAGCFASTAAFAQTAVSSDRVQSAAVEYDAGRRAFLEQRFDEAAVHFENAWHDAPRAEALRNAIRARREASQLARAATLATIAERVYHDDPTTMDLVRETLSASAPKLQKVTVTCTPECTLAADGRAITLEVGARFTFFLDPGPHDVRVTWTEDRSKHLSIVGVAGAADDLEATAPPLPPVLVKPVAPETPPVPVRVKPLGPVPFFVGVGLTAVGIAATIVSGVDAQNDPGTEVVRRECVGLGEECPTYQRGRSAQLRTNVLLGVTIGVAVVTGVIGVVLTQWSPPAAVRVRGSTPTPGTRSLRPTLDARRDGGAFGIAGEF